MGGSRVSDDEARRVRGGLGGHKKSKEEEARGFKPLGCSNTRRKKELSPIVEYRAGWEGEQD